MENLIKIDIPDLEGVDNVPIEEIWVNVGDEVNVGDSIVSVETEKTIIEIPSPYSGTIREVLCSTGDTVSVGDSILVIEVNKSTNENAEKPVEVVNEDLVTQVVVLGAGPGGYSAAFRAADLGKKVVLVEKSHTLGGVCLNVGCIPSKALLHVAKIISETKEMSDFGIKFSPTELDINKLRNWKNKVILQLTNGLTSLAKQRKVKVVKGVGTFTSSNEVNVDIDDVTKISIKFDQAIIAAGSEPIKIPDFPHDDSRVLTSTEALEIGNIPDRLLVVGGGIIGLEMATVYHELGAKVTIIEFADTLIPGADPDLVKPLHQRIAGMYENIFLSTKVTSIESTLNGMYVKYEDTSSRNRDVFDQVLIAVGRKPNGNLIGAEKAGVNVDDRGFIATDDQMRTNVNNIFAIGDVVGQPMLAHKATHEGKVAAEAIAGKDSHFDASLIPSVAYTDPEIAWVGITENSAKELNIDYKKGIFPWAASGRALSIERKEGFTKTLYDSESQKIIGAGIIGTNAGELISEAALAIHKGCTSEELGELIHPHPTLSETVGLSAEVVDKTIVDLYVK